MGVGKGHAIGAVRDGPYVKILLVGHQHLFGCSEIIFFNGGLDWYSSITPDELCYIVIGNHIYDIS